MIRLLLFLALTALPLLAEDELALAINIQSPDTATTFALGVIKSRALIWSDSTKTLSAEVTFEERDPTNLQANEDTHRFRLPGVTFDKDKGIFYATSAAGEVIPIARRKTTLIFTSIEALPNAIVRVFHRRGDVNVSLEAIRPADMAKFSRQQGGDNPDHTHSINVQNLMP